MVEFEDCHSKILDEHWRIKLGISLISSNIYNMAPHFGVSQSGTHSSTPAFFTAHSSKPFDLGALRPLKRWQLGRSAWRNRCVCISLHHGRITVIEFGPNLRDVDVILCWTKFGITLDYPFKTMRRIKRTFSSTQGPKKSPWPRQTHLCSDVQKKGNGVDEVSARFFRCVLWDPHTAMWVNICCIQHIIVSC